MIDLGSSDGFIPSQYLLTEENRDAKYNHQNDHQINRAICVTAGTLFIYSLDQCRRARHGVR